LPVPAFDLPQRLELFSCANYANDG